MNGVYKCLYSKGYTGMNCETEINECDSSPCVNGTRSNVVNAYRCNCSPGYGGTNCEGTTVVFTTRKRSLGQGNVFTPVCQSFCSQGAPTGTQADTPPHN